MSKKSKFVNEVKKLLDSVGNYEWQSEEAKIYWETLQTTEDKEKPLFTENGRLILQFLQDNQDTTLWKAKDIAEGMFVSSRTVSGALRKLVTDEYVEKMGENPTIYSITEKGKNINLEENK